VLAWTRTWYPGVTDAAGAGKFVLSAGGDLDNIVIRLKAAPAHAVRGVLRSPEGKPAAGVEVTLSSTRGLFKTKSGEDGSFEFVTVDGDWRLSADAQAGARSDRLRASRFVTVAGRDLEGVKLQLDAPVAVELRVVAQAPEDGAAPPFRPPPMMFTAVDPSGVGILGDRVLARPEADGTYHLSGVYPRSYELGGQPPPGYYLGAMRLGETPVAGRTVELTAGAVLTVVFQADGGAVRGTVENCGDGGVLLVPQDPAARRSEEIRRTLCEAGGRYEFAGVRPGDYYVIALLRDPSAYFWSMEWKDAMEKQSASATVKAKEAVTLDLKAVAEQ